MSAAIVLVRHAMSAVERGVASRLWGITDSAREDCVLLSEHLPAKLSAAIYTSDERKAFETATVIGLRRGCEVRVDARFAEVDRPTTWDTGYRERAASCLAGAELPGWEPIAAVQRRFEEGVTAACAATAPDECTVIVDHGLALSLYLASRNPVIEGRDGAAAFELVPFWQSLAFPDAWLLDFESNSVRRLYAAGLPPPDA